jgi:anti-sigma regulatory factor (Ser/Thr protein kinase)
MDNDNLKYNFEYEIIRNGKSRMLVLPDNIDANIINNVLVRFLRYTKRKISTELYLEKLQKKDLQVLAEIGFLDYWNISPTVEKSDNIKGIFPVTKIDSTSQVVTIIENLYSNLIKYFGVSNEWMQNFFEDYTVTISELIQNIPIHSEGEGFLYIYCTEEDNGLFLNCGIADDGIGIANTLKDYQLEYRHFWNDSFAITLALQKGVSRFRKTESGRGKGLFGLYNRIQKWDGSLYLRSGKGLFVYNNKDYKAVELGNALMGVQIYIKIPIKNVQ